MRLFSPHRFVATAELGSSYSYQCFLAADSSRDMAGPFAAAAAATPQAGQAQDYNKLFKAERDNLEFSEGLHSWVAKDVDVRILKKYGRLPASSK